MTRWTTPKTCFRRSQWHVSEWSAMPSVVRFSQTGTFVSLNGHHYVGLFLDCTVSLIYAFIHLLTLFIILALFLNILKLGSVFLQTFFYFKITIAHLVLMFFHIDFRFYVSLKKKNLWYLHRDYIKSKDQFGKKWPLTMLSHPWYFSPLYKPSVKYLVLNFLELFVWYVYKYILIFKILSSNCLLLEIRNQINCYVFTLCSVVVTYSNPLVLGGFCIFLEFST